MIIRGNPECRSKLLNIRLCSVAGEIPKVLRVSLGFLFLGGDELRVCELLSLLRLCAFRDC